MVILNKLACEHAGVDSILPAELRIATSAANCLLLGVVINVIAMFGVVSVVEGKALVVLSETSVADTEVVWQSIRGSSVEA